MTKWGYLVIFCVVLVAVAVVLAHRMYTKRTMKKIEEMIGCAMQGDFEESRYDESLLSALETKFAHYLAASVTSGQKLQTEKDKIKSLIADISHQTKTPIANVLLYTQLLGEEELSEAGQFYVGELESQAKKLQLLIEALVKTSRLEAGVLTLHPVHAKIEPVIQSAVSQLIPKAEEKKIRLSAVPTNVEALFDPKWTEEALVNLLDNAIKYTQEGGEVTVRVSEYQMFASICVKDNGPGIPEEEQAKVFQRFYRGIGQRKEDGVGIGLYLARQIAQGQGGYIRVQSEKGKGTEFSLYLPRD